MWRKTELKKARQDSVRYNYFFEGNDLGMKYVKRRVEETTEIHCGRGDYYGSEIGLSGCRG